ncbi:MAG: hypothetical protein ABID54_04875, partial [Pseudomonadota bacterium]
SEGIGVGFKEASLRGIEVSVPDSGVYALTDSDPTSIDPTREGFDTITLFAKNISAEDVEMNGGTVHLILKYMVSQQNQFRPSPPNPVFAFRHIQKSLPGIQSIPKDDYVKFEFHLGQEQIPMYATDLYFYLVYNETTGEGAQNAFVGFRDISEPTPLDYYNSMDKICLSNQFYDAGGAAAIELVDQDGDGIAEPPMEWDVYAHDRKDVYIRYSPSGDPQKVSLQSHNYKIPYQAAGEYTRLFVLSDEQFCFSASDGEIVMVDSRDGFGHYPGNYQGDIFVISSIRNQVRVTAPGDSGYNPDTISYIRYVPWFHRFRDIESSWINHSVSNRPYPADSVCTFD